MYLLLASTSGGPMQVQNTVNPSMEESSAQVFQAVDCVPNNQNLVNGEIHIIENKENISNTFNAEKKTIENGTVENSYDSIMN